MVLLHRFFASVGGTGGSRGWSLGCVGEWHRASGREKGMEEGSVGRNTAGKGARKGDVIGLREVGRASGSALELEGGKGYSKRGETSNGVPRIEDGECRERSDKSKRGLREVGLAATL